MQLTSTFASSLSLGAYTAAMQYRNEEIGPLHVLWALCRDENGRVVVESRGGDYPLVLRLLAETFRGLARDESSIPRFSKDAVALLEACDKDETLQTQQEHFTLSNAAFDCLVVEANFFKDLEEVLLLSGLIEKVSYNEETGEVTSFNPFAFTDGEPDDVPPEEKDGPRNLFEDPGLSGLEMFKPSSPSQDPNVQAATAAMRDLSKEAQSGPGTPLVGREDILEEMFSVLERRLKPNPLLVGEPGVGKTALVEGLARVLAARTSSSLHGRPVIEVQMGALLANTRFRGDFEARVRHVLEVAASRKAILFIDEAHSLMGLGGSSSGGIDVVTLLKPLLARGDFSVILATTPGELRPLMKDKAFARRFQKIMIKEPDTEQTCAILESSKEAYETHYKVSVASDLLLGMVEMMKDASPERRFPDKALDALDASCAHARKRGATALAQEDIDGGVFSVSGVRYGRPTKKDVALAETIEDRLKGVVLGQEAALAVLASSVRLRLLGMRDLTGCASAHLFNGPTGVGKTQAAQALASLLDIPLVRIDMSEYMDAHSVAGLIGAPPGYVGFQEEGQLTGAAESHPRMVLLLDEVDKAHPKVFDLLLQVLDAGHLRSADGREVSFKGAHVVMTANIGAAAADKPAFGFGRTRDPQEEMQAAVAAHFRPEFAERLNAVVNFEPLTRDIAVTIASRHLAAAMDRFSRNGMLVHINASVASELVDQIDSDSWSGRRIARLVETRVIDAVAMSVFKQDGPGPFVVSLKDGRGVLEAA